MPTPGTREFFAAFICLALALAGCSKDQSKTSPPPTSPSSPSPTPIPSFTTEQIKSSLLDERDLGKDWKETEQLSAFKEGELRGCSEARIELIGEPARSSKKFGGPDHSFTGANYARFIAVYKSADQASDAFEQVRNSLAKCPDKKKIPFKRLPKKKFVYQHDDTWKLTENEIEGWRHARGSEKSVYPESVSLINVIHYSIDYAQRGNVIFSSMYYQRAKPKESSDPIFEAADEILLEQLKRFR
ncbi:hypothetical protein [Actinocorallia libanotica]|uniref:PknH-like protein n=1 Tax=Actinocorallia libanotica TaxID=46162 RepID=A0ABN1R624_9ACTN